MWLDFSEIPPAKLPSKDTEAFEKFAKQFFEDLYGATIIKGPGRGSDGGADLIVEIKKERWLISCKHYLSSSVTGALVTDPRGDLDTHGCDKYVLFLSGSANNSLNARLSGIKENRKPFDFQIFDNETISAKIFSTKNAKGWILAARWFPKSYAKLFSQIVYPITHYSDSDITIDRENGTMSPGTLPFKISFVQESKQSEEIAREAVLLMANEHATATAFDGIFLSRVAEFASLFPGTFVKMRFVGSEDLRTKHVYSSWNFGILADIIKDEHLSGATITSSVTAICRVWSFWSVNCALKYLRVAQMLISHRREYRDQDISNIDSIISQFEAKHGLGSMAYHYEVAHEELTISTIGSRESTLERGFYAALLCFAPSSLLPTPQESQTIAWLAKNHGEETILKTRIGAFLSELNESDKMYVLRHNAHLLNELIQSVYLVLNKEKKEIFIQCVKPGLKCFSESAMEPWTPSVNMSVELAAMLKGE